MFCLDLFLKEVARILPCILQGDKLGFFVFVFLFYFFFSLGITLSCVPLIHLVQTVLVVGFTYTGGILTLHTPTLKPPYDHNIFKLSQPLLLMKTLSLSFKASCYA